MINPGLIFLALLGGALDLLFLVGIARWAWRSRLVRRLRPHTCNLECVGQRGPEVLIWRCQTCGKEFS